MISKPAMIERAARLNPEGMCTRYKGREYSWRETESRVARRGAALASLGLADADRVAILSLNSDRYYESVFAIPWAGACVVPLNTRWALAENKYAVADSGARVLLFDDAFTSHAEDVLSAIHSSETVIYIGDGQTPAWARSYEQML